MREDPLVLVIGMTTVDMLFAVRKFPGEDTENYATRQGIVVGGPAGRAAITATRLGGRVVQLSTIGTDQFSDLLKSLTEDAGVVVEWFETAGESQSSAVLLSDDTGARTTIWRPQPPADADFLRRIKEVAASASVILVDCTDAATTAAVQEAKDHAHARVVIDTGSYKSWAEPLLHGLDYIVSPEKFLTSFIHDRLPDYSGKSLIEQLRAAREYFGCHVLTITQGGNGGLYCDRQGVVFHYPPYRVTTVDSCGAGDTFHGAFAWALAHGSGVAEAHAVAAWAAGKKCAVFGNPGLPTAAELSEDKAEIGRLTTAIERQDR